MDSKRIGVTPFIKKMISILQKPQFQHIINWDPEKKLIEVVDQSLLEEIVLPQYFKHQKMQSFVRQLNLYGFKKLRSEEYIKFRHDDLENGRSLHQIQTQRRIKRSKKFEQQSLEQNIQSSEKGLRQILQNNVSKSIEIKKQFQNNENKTKQQIKTMPQVSQLPQILNPSFLNPFMNRQFSMHQSLPQSFPYGFYPNYYGIQPPMNYYNPWY